MTTREREELRKRLKYHTQKRDRVLAQLSQDFQEQMAEHNPDDGRTWRTTSLDESPPPLKPNEQRFTAYEEPTFKAEHVAPLLDKKLAEIERFGWTENKNEPVWHPMSEKPEKNGAYLVHVKIAGTTYHRIWVYLSTWGWSDEMTPSVKGWTKIPEFDL